MADTNRGITVELRLRVTYDTHGESLETLVAQLQQALNHVAQNGIFSGETEAVVTDYRYNIEEVIQARKGIAFGYLPPEDFEAVDDW